MNLGYQKSGPRMETATARFERNVERERVKISTAQTVAPDNEEFLTDSNVVQVS